MLKFSEVNKMKKYFYKLADHTVALAGNGEFIYLNFSGEQSDFVRFNHAKIRQNGNVAQYYLSISLIYEQKQTSSFLTLTLNQEQDIKNIDETVKKLRDTIKEVDKDPYLLYSTNVESTETEEESHLPDSTEIVEDIMKEAGGNDLVGILSTGNIISGFANSAGQKNWFEKPSFNFDWSIYHTTDKAVKAGYAGYYWNSDEFSKKMDKVKAELEIMKRDALTIKPGKYRVYLAPAALESFMSVLGWGGFGLKSQKTKNSALVKLVENEVRLHEGITILEHCKDGGSPNFNSKGFIKPHCTALVENGKHKGSLINPRSAKEYGVEQNGANSMESPEALEMCSGNIESSDILKELGTGIYLNHVHYLNYSERVSCRMTGMSRFAAFYVENGEIIAPVNVMRFDESLFRMLGENFAGATVERERMMSTNTYGGRQTDSTLLPGIIVNDFSFTL
jgi:predicted Zn-dependent protease